MKRKRIEEKDGRMESLSAFSKSTFRDGEGIVRRRDSRGRATICARCTFRDVRSEEVVRPGLETPILFHLWWLGWRERAWEEGVWRNKRMWG